MIEDHAGRVDRLQRSLAAAWLERPELLNQPGAALACKIDPHYFLGLHPGFMEFLAKSAGMFQKNVRQSLLRTGNLLAHAESGEESIMLNVLWEESGKVRRARLASCFIHNSFIDRALLLYGRQGQEMPVSSLAIAGEDETKAQAFLQGRTQLQGMAFRHA